MKSQTITIIFWLFLSILSGETLFAQKYSYPISPAFRNYTTEDGLPSNEVYQVKQDANGYLWFATDRGVARYNGTEFKSFGIDEGLAGTSVFGFKFDRHNKLWCYNYQYEVYSFDGNHFHRHPISDTVKKHSYKINDIFWQHDTLWVSTHSEVIKAYPNGQIVTMSGLTDEKGIISIYKVNDSSYAPMLNSYLNSSLTSTKGISGFAFHNGKEVEVTQLDKPVPFNLSSILLFPLVHNGILYLVCGNYLIIKEGNQYHFKSYKQPINHSLYFDRGNRFWTGNFRGANLFENGNFDEPSATFLEDYIITSCFQDNEYGYWFSTKGYGVFYLPRSALQTIKDKETDNKNRIKSVAIVGDTVVFNDFDSILYYIKMPTGSFGKQSFDNFDNIRLVSTKYNNLFALKGQTRLLKFINNRYKQFFFNKNGYAILLNDESCLYAENNTGDSSETLYQPSIWKPETISILKFQQSNSRFQHHFINAEHLYMANRFGVEIYELNGNKLPPDKPEVLSSRVNGLTGNDSLVMIATAGVGVLVCRGNKIINQIRRQDGLTDDQCNDVFLDENGKLWVSTNNGLSSIENPQFPGKFVITNYTIGQGIPSRQIHSAVARNGWVALITSSGVSYFYENDLKEIDPKFPVYISKMEIERQEIKNFEPGELSYNQNNIYIEYEAVTYQFANELKFRYRLVGLDTTWRYTNDLTVEYNNLSPGEYSFELQGGTTFHGWSSKTTGMSFTIKPPIWTTWWFISLMLLLIIELIFLFISWRIKVLGRRQRIENRLFFYRQQAIGLQMNPHFLFNSVASIQAHILKNDQKSLLRHIASFAKLIRLIFEISKKNLVSLNDEIKALQHYLEFEKLRFKDKLNYQFNIDPAIDLENTKVPPLLIQPVVENAVKHGRNIENGKGHIIINIKKRNSSLIFEVEDTGIGFSNTSALSTDKLQMHVSAGLSLVRKRLNLLEEWIRKPTKLRIISGEERKGTLVVIEIPILTNTSEE